MFVSYFGLGTKVLHCKIPSTCAQTHTHKHIHRQHVTHVVGVGCKSEEKMHGWLEPAELALPIRRVASERSSSCSPLAIHVSHMVSTRELKRNQQ